MKMLDRLFYYICLMLAVSALYFGILIATITFCRASCVPFTTYTIVITCIFPLGFVAAMLYAALQIKDSKEVSKDD